MRRLASVVVGLVLVAAAVVAWVFMGESQPATTGTSQPATTELTDEQIAAIEAEVNAVADEALAAIAALDVDRHLDFYANSDDFTVAVYGAVHRSFPTWAEMARAGFSEIESVEDCAFSDEVVQVLAPNVAIFTADFGCTGTAVGGGPLVGHTVTAVMVRLDGEWKCVNFSETFPPGETSTEGT